jgi:AraC family transcriptional regulator of adaptative response/methylated-DNA-[protein]-cysteine methyltransferase
MEDLNMNTNYETVATAIRYISDNFQEQPELDDIAKMVHMSPFHFQRVFSEWAGISPKRFLQYITTGYLKEKLHRTENLLEAAQLAGLSAQSRVYDLFITLEAVTPNQFKTKGEGLEISYGFHWTPFGECFVAVTEKGVCALEFVNDHNSCLNDFRNAWQNARLAHDPGSTAVIIEKIFDPAIKERKLHLLVKGTNFQVKVWEALVKIPFGQLTSYQEIAEFIDSPKAVRAVGSAVGKNPVAYLIPCHRVIRKEGKIGGYHWGIERKQAMLGWEMARA